MISIVLSSLKMPVLEAILFLSLWGMIVGLHRFHASHHRSPAHVIMETLQQRMSTEDESYGRMRKLLRKCYGYLKQT